MRTQRSKDWTSHEHRVVTKGGHEAERSLNPGSDSIGSEDGLETVTQLGTQLYAQKSSKAGKLPKQSNLVPYLQRLTVHGKQISS